MLEHDHNAMPQSHISGTNEGRELRAPGSAVASLICFLIQAIAQVNTRKRTLKTMCVRGDPVILCRNSFVLALGKGSSCHDPHFYFRDSGRQRGVSATGVYSGHELNSSIAVSTIASTDSSGEITLEKPT